MKRTKPRYHHGDLRNALVKAALKLVEEGGAQHFSLREAARAVGVTANAAYRHFADKSDLVVAVVEVGYARLELQALKAMASISAGQLPAASAVERLKAAGRAYVDFAVNHPELLQLMTGSNGLALLEAGRSKPTPFQLLGKALDDLVEAGVLSPDRRPGAELMAWTAVHGFASLLLQSASAARRRATRSAMLEAVLDFAVVGLCGRL